MSSYDKYNQVQLMTMSAIDFLDQWFETDVLKATMSASGIIGTFLGVRSPGTAYVLLHHYMGEIDGAFRAWGFARGGTGAISNAIADAAREAGVEIRTQAAISQIIVKNGKAKGVVLANGDEIYAEVISSSVDPRLTFTKFMGREHLPGDFLEEVNRYKYRGSSGKVNMALMRAAELQMHAGAGRAFAGSDFDFAFGGIHGTGVRRCEVRQVFAAAIHRHGDSIVDRSFGGAPGKACVVVLRAVCALQAAARPELGYRKEAFGDTVVNTIAEYAPNIKDIIIREAGRHAARSGARVGIERRQHFPGRAFAGAAVLFASGAGLGAVPHTHQEPIYVRIGNTSWRRHHGRERAVGGAGNSERHQGSGVAMATTRRDVVIIGGGHNGLVTAFYLAKAGYKPLVLERGAQVGGAAVTDEFHPGFRCSTLAHTAGPIRPDVVRDMQLEKHGLKWITPDVCRNGAFA